MASASGSRKRLEVSFGAALIQSETGSGAVHHLCLIDIRPVTSKPHTLAPPCSGDVINFYFLGARLRFFFAFFFFNHAFLTVFFHAHTLQGEEMPRSHFNRFDIMELIFEATP